MRETASGAAPSVDAIAARWKALHDQATAVGQMAQLSPERFEGALADFPGRICGASSWKLALALQGIEDIDAMMQPGLAALSTVTARGGSAHVPALALWREFYNARTGVMALAQDLPAHQTA